MSNRFAMFRAKDWGRDVISSGIVLVLAVVLFPLQFFVSSIYLTTVPVVLAAASGIYLLTRRYESDGAAINRYRYRFESKTARLLALATYVGLAGMVFAGTYTGGRTIQFYAVTVPVGLLVFAQILLLRKEALRPRSILFQTVALAVILRAAALATTPGFIGIDAWTHITDYAAAIRNTGSLTAIADVKYFAAPLYHLLVVVAADALDTSLRTALYATLGIVMPLSVLLVFVTTHQLLPVRWALFATAAYSVADQVIRWGLHLIPTSLGLVFFLAVCYGVAKIYTGGRSWRVYGLVLTFAVATVFTHQISSVILLGFLGAGTAAQVYFWLFGPRGDARGATGSDGHVNFAGLFAAVLPLAIFNLYRAPSGEGSFLELMIGVAARAVSDAGFLELASASTSSNSAIESLAVETPLWLQFVDTVGFLVLLLMAVIGSFMILRRQSFESLSLAWILSAVAMAVVTLGMPLLGLYFLIPLRWYAFMYVPMVVLSAYGMWHLERAASLRVFAVVAILFVLLFTGPMIVDQTATRDGPVADDHYHRYAFTDAELEAAGTISTIHPDGATIATDQPYRLLFRDWQRQSSATMTLNESGTVSDEYVVYRRYQTENGPQVLYNGTIVRVQLPLGRVCHDGTNVVYTNGAVTYCSGD